jgi:hypothetical protein
MSPDELEELGKKHRSPDRQIIRRWDRSMSRPTVGQLVLWCVEAGLDLSEVRVTGSEISWEDIETDEERDKRISLWTAADRAREEAAHRTVNVTTRAMEEQWPIKTHTTA